MKTAEKKCRVLSVEAALSKWVKAKTEKRSREIELRAATGSVVESLEKRTLFTGGWGGTYWDCIPFDIGPYCSCDDPPKPSHDDPNGSGGLTPTKASGIGSDPVRYFDGLPVINSNDVTSDGFGKLWGQGRSYSETQISGPMGNHWVLSDLPYLSGDAASYPGTPIVAVASGTDQRWFTSTDSGATYSQVFGNGDSLTVVPPLGGDGYFILTDSIGGQVKYDDFANADHPGQFESYTDPYGNVTEVVSHDGDGQVTEVQRASGSTVESWLYHFTTITGSSQEVIDNVQLRRSTNSGSTFTVVKQVDYQYYDDSTAGGGLLDLQSATTKDGSGNVIDTTVYRYWKTVGGVDEQADGVNQQPGTIKFIFDSAAVARALANGVDPATSSDTDVAPYANNYFTYYEDNTSFPDGIDAEWHVHKETAAGAGGDATGGQGTLTYEYDSNFYTAPDGDYNFWKFKTTETLPSGSKNVIYSNAEGETMLKVAEDAGGTATSAEFWAYDNRGRVVLDAKPSAIDLPSLATVESYNDLLNNQFGHYQYLRDSSGLIQATDYYSKTDTGLTDGSAGGSNVSGGVLGYLRDDTVQQGQLSGDQSPTSITYGFPGGIFTATVTFASAHGLNAGDVIQVSGADQSQYDGRFVIDSVPSSTTVTYILAEDPTSDATTTGGGTLDVVRPTLIDRKAYFSRDDGAGNYVYPVASISRFRNTDGTGEEKTTHTYTWYSGTLGMKSDTTTLPGISAAQNGPGTGSPDTSTNYLDSFGRIVFHKDGSGSVNFIKYDTSGSGGIVKTMVDVDTSASSDFTGGVSPSTFSGLSSSGTLKLTTVYSVDGQGRMVKETDPNGNVTYVVYKDPDHEVRVYPGFDGSTTTGPIQVMRTHYPASGTPSGEVLYYETLTSNATPHLNGSGVPDGAETLSASNIQTLSRQITNDAGQVIESDDYYSLAGLTYDQTGPQITGATYSNDTTSDNYHRTLYGYNTSGKVNRVISPTLTITRTVSDSLGRVSSLWSGTNDTPVSGIWSPTNAAGMTKIQEDYYDTYDPSTPGFGDGNLTRVVTYPNSTTAPRATEVYYDWRDRAVATKASVLLDGSNRFANPTGETDNVYRPINYYTSDNLDEVTQVDSFNGDGQTISFSGGVPVVPTSSTRTARSIAYYDDQGRVYRTSVFSVDPTNGANISTASLNRDTYFDSRGNVIANYQPGGLASKYAYDAAGRVIHQYTSDGASLNATTHSRDYTNAANVAFDVILSQVDRTYDNNGNVIQTATRQRFHNDATNSVSYLGLGNPTTAPSARVSYNAFYYDAANRLTDAVDVGTYGGSTFTRDATHGTDPTNRSGVYLLTHTDYSPGGWANTVTDAKGNKTHTVYDMLGRTTKTIAAWDGTSDSPTVGAVANQLTEYTHDGNDHVLTMKAWNKGTGTATFQTTKYVYGITKSAGNGVDSNDVLLKVQYPDKSTGNAGTGATNEVSYKYDALGEQTGMTDRNGTVHAYTYDPLGRKTLDTVTTFGSYPIGTGTASIDNFITKIAYSYGKAGNPFKTSSYHNSTINNEVEDVYNGLGQLTTEYQEHYGAVDEASSAKVQYHYRELTDGSGPVNDSRKVSMTYPDGRVITTTYNPGLDSAISRPSAIADTGGTLEGYTYLGLSTIVEQTRPENSTKLSYIKQSTDTLADTTSAYYGGDQYTGLDRFGRVADQWWLNYSGSGTPTATVDRFQYGYDANSNALYKNNLGPGTSAASFSELYHASGAANGYDTLDRLTGFARGTLSKSGGSSVFDTVASATTGVSGVHGTENWTLDAQGNWAGTNAVTVDGSAQNRSDANAQNEQTSVTTDSGAHTLEYDYNGSLIKDDNGNTLYYDAWGRLREVDGPLGVAEKLLYDGLHRDAVSANFSPTRIYDLYYSKDWQLIQQDSPLFGVTAQELVWSSGWGSYIDDLVERDRFLSTTNTSISERLYAEHDANHNVTSITDDSAGTVQERFVYDPYGSFATLTSTWGTPSGSTVTATDWNYYHQGGRYDNVTKLYTFRYRNYSATIGRWVEQDPAGYVGGPNRYQYVGGRPISRIDPRGLLGQNNGASTQSTTQPQPIFPDEPPLDFSGMGKNEFANFVQRTLRNLQRLKAGIELLGNIIDLSKKGCPSYITELLEWLQHMNYDDAERQMRIKDEIMKELNLPRKDDSIT